MSCQSISVATFKSSSHRILYAEAAFRLLFGNVAGARPKSLSKQLEISLQLYLSLHYYRAAPWSLLPRIEALLDIRAVVGRGI